MQKKLLIAGASGQLARTFIRALATSDRYTVIAPTEQDFNITDPATVDACVAQHKPDILLNCAAYNAVDAAESDADTARLVNTTAVELLAAACQRHHARLVHFGTDFVFDGDTERPYIETDPTAPLGVYGATKRDGELAALAASPDNLVLRLSWVYGHGPQNFLFKLRQWSASGNPLKIVTDEVSVPTFTDDIVTYTLKAMAAELTGLYHLTNSGYATRYEVARHYLNLIGRDNIVIPTTIDSFPTPAKRPFFSAMSNAKLSAALNEPIPPWQEAMARFANQPSL
jgi:dTDP-4-dehydrorhamnose reductase